MSVKKWLGILCLSSLLVFSGSNTAQAAITKGEFTPVCNINSMASESKIKYYEIKKGDTLWEIARKHQVELATILLMNNLNQNSILAVGQTLEIPYNKARIHTIAKGETMWDIAQKYGIAVNQIKRVNPGKNPAALKIGDKLDIPDSIESRNLIAYNEASRSAVRSATQFIWPLTGVITSKFGWRSSGFHHGIDIAGEKGVPIKAAAAGKVIFTDYKNIYGKILIIEHSNGYETWYAHLDSFRVSKGNQVTKGQNIGTVGTTGNTTGPHVHFEIRKDSQNIDPITMLP